MKSISTEAIYKTNDDFKEYVNRYASQRHILVIDALHHKTVEEVADYYLKQSLEKIDE